MLTHHPEDAVPAKGVTFLSCHVAEAGAPRDGIRLVDKPGGRPVRLLQSDAEDPVAAVNVRYRPVGSN